MDGRGRGRRVVQPEGRRDRRSCSEGEDEEAEVGNRDGGGDSARRVIPGFYFDEVAQVATAPHASSRAGVLPAGGAASLLAADASCSPLCTPLTSHMACRPTLLCRKTGASCPPLLPKLLLRRRSNAQRPDPRPQPARRSGRRALRERVRVQEMELARAPGVAWRRSSARREGPQWARLPGMHARWAGWRKASRRSQASSRSRPSLNAREAEPAPARA